MVAAYGPAMTSPATTNVYARVNHGRWIADCPRKYCANAMALERGQAAFQCGGEGGCGMQAYIVWPADTDLITAALLQRPVPSTRNWYPIGHPEAVQLGLEHGQSVDDLLAETRAYEGEL